MTVIEIELPPGRYALTLIGGAAADGTPGQVVRHTLQIKHATPVKVQFSSGATPGSVRVTNLDTGQSFGVRPATSTVVSVGLVGYGGGCSSGGRAARVTASSGGLHGGGGSSMTRTA